MEIIKDGDKLRITVKRNNNNYYAIDGLYESDTLQDLLDSLKSTVLVNRFPFFCLSFNGKYFNKDDLDKKLSELGLVNNSVIRFINFTYFDDYDFPKLKNNKAIFYCVDDDKAGRIFEKKKKEKKNMEEDDDDEEKEEEENESEFRDMLKNNDGNYNDLRNSNDNNQNSLPDNNKFLITNDCLSKNNSCSQSKYGIKSEKYSKIEGNKSDESSKTPEIIIHEKIIENDNFENGSQHNEKEKEKLNYKSKNGEANQIFEEKKKEDIKRFDNFDNGSKDSKKPYGFPNISESSHQHKQAKIMLVIIDFFLFAGAITTFYYGLSIVLPVILTVLFFINSVVIFFYGEIAAKISIETKNLKCSSNGGDITKQTQQSEDLFNDLENKNNSTIPKTENSKNIGRNIT